MLFSRLLIYCVMVLCLILCTTNAHAEKDLDKKYKGNAKSIELNEKGALAAQAKDYKQAKELFRQSVAADAYNLTAVYNLAGLYLKEKDYKQAISLLSEYSAKDIKDPGIYVRLGDAYFSSREPASACTWYEKAYKLDAQYSGLHAKLATLYTMMNRYEEAESMLLKAIEDKPKDGQLLTNLSSVFLANNKPEKAIGAAKRGLQVKATSELYVNLGSAYEVLKDFKSSLIAFQRARDLGDLRNELKEKIDYLKKLTS